MLRRTAILTLLLCLTIHVVAQTHVHSSDSTSERRARGVVDNPKPSDSVLRSGVYTFRMRPLAVKIDAIDNILLDPTGAQHHDPLNAIDGHYYLSKGIVGQSHLAAFPTLIRDIEWRYQPDVNEGYTRTPYNQLFYQTRRPYSLLAYSSSLKKEYTLRAIHSQNIIPRWNVALDYQLFNPDPIYSNEETKNNYLTVNTNYYSIDSRYQAYLMWIWQRSTIGENGGLTNDNTFRNNTLSDLSGLPVRSYTDVSVYHSTQLYTHQTYNLVRQVQRVRQRTELEVNALDTTLLDTLVFYDTIAPAAHHIINPGVIGLDATLMRSARRYHDSTTVFHQSLRLFWSNDAYLDTHYSNPVRITLAAEPHHYRINEHDSLRYEWSSLVSSAQLTLILGDDTLAGACHLTSGDAICRGDRLLQAHYTYRMGAMRHLTLGVASTHTHPDFFYYHYHSNGLDWDATLDKVATERYSVDYYNTRWLHLMLVANHRRNHTYLVTSGSGLAPVQCDGDLWIWQAQLTARLTLFGWLRYHGEQSLQHSSDIDQWDVPFWTSKNSFYADFPLFHRAMRMQTGVDIRYHTRFYADAYHPAAGAFVRQRDVLVGNFMWGDIFVNMQVQHVNIFLKFGHVNALWEMNPDYFLLPHYPGNKFGFYYGLTWNFFD